MKNIFNYLNSKFGRFIFLALIFLGMLFILTKLADLTKNKQLINYTEFLKYIENDKIKNIEISGQYARGEFKIKNKKFEVILPQAQQEEALIYQKLKDHDVQIEQNSPNNEYSPWFILFLASLILVPAGIWLMFNQAKNGSNSGGAGNIFSMNKSRARLIMPSEMGVNFDSVAGVAEAKEELKEIVDFLKEPEKFKKLGARLPKGVLLTGEPGNGKTLLAKAVAGEANCPFFSVSGADFAELFVGVGASRVRDMFAQARKNAPSIIFIDEIDTIGRQRGGVSTGNEEREQTLNQLLTEMDGFDNSPMPVIVIGATNRPDILDKALLRPGRFDRKVYVPYPDIKSRKEILEVHAKNKPIDVSVNLNKIAKATTGFTGADLANLINESALHAAQKKQNKILITDFEEARDKIMLGKERKGVIRTKEELEITAYHESGHALIGLLLPNDSDPLYKITILPRGQALGVTHSLPERDKHTRSKEEFDAMVLSALGGRAAEELVFNKLETGAYSDFQKATNLVHQMICNYGMSKTLGLVVYDKNDNYQYSEETAKLIDNETRNLMAEYYAKTLNMLKENRDKLEILAKKLLEKETLFAEEIYELLSITPRETHNIAD